MRIAPDTICRLVFAVMTAEDGTPKTDLVQADLTSASWKTITAGVHSASTGVTITGSSPVASSASKVVGQLVDINSTDGLYAVDCPATASVNTADSSEAVIVLDDGTLSAHAATHVIDTRVSGGVQVTDIDSATLAKFVTEDTGETTATAGSVSAISQGGAVDNSAQLTRIENQTSQISAGKVSVVSNVSEGGDISVHLGDDDTGAEAILVPVSDTGEALKDLLQAADSVLFAVGYGSKSNVILGTIDAGSITHADGITSIPVEIPSANKVSASTYRTDYVYHIKSVTSDLEKVKVSGGFVLLPEHATPTA